MNSINPKKLLYLYIGLGFIILILGCEASRVLLPELHGDDTNWLKTESAHYFIYYRPGSPASENIERISKDLDSCFFDVLAQLAVDFRAKIHYYLYNSKQDMERNTRRDYVGVAFPEFQCAAQICSSKFTKFDAHETVHIIVDITIGIAKFRFLEEGTAEAVAHCHDEESPGKLSLHEEAHMLFYWGELFSFKVLTNNDRFLEIRRSERAHDLYTTCGSFVRYLIDQYTLEKFKFFYPRAGEDDYAEVFQDIYGKGIYDFEKEWHEFLRNY